MDGSWTDSTVNTAPAQRPAKSERARRRQVRPEQAVPYRRRLELQVGRVDLANLPAFSQSEPELLRQYLNKDHDFRHKLITAERRGLIDDNLG